MSDFTLPTFGTFTRVYCGVRVSKQRRRTYAWADAENARSAGLSASYYLMPKLQPPTAIIGGQYTFTWADEGHTRFYAAGPSGPTYEGLFPTETTIATWIAAHQAANIMLAALLEERRAGRSNLLRHTLAPLHAVYAEASPRQRRALEALTLAYLRGEA